MNFDEIQSCHPTPLRTAMFAIQPGPMCCPPTQMRQNVSSLARRVPRQSFCHPCVNLCDVEMAFPSRIMNPRMPRSDKVVGSPPRSKRHQLFVRELSPFAPSAPIYRFELYHVCPACELFD